MEEELEKIKVNIKKLNEEKELGDISEEEYNEKVCEYFCNAAESSSLSSLLFLSSLLPSQLFLNYRSIKTGEKGWKNAILYASKGASIEVMEFLLSFGFNINSLSTYEENCLSIAVKNGGSKEYIEYLFSKDATFLQTTKVRNFNLCEILLRDRKYDNKDVLEILKYLIEERGVDIHSINNTIIELATSHKVEIMKYLVVSLQFDITSQFNFFEKIIQLAIKANNIEVIDYLISLKPDLKYKDFEYSLFLYAVKYSNLKVIQYLVSLNQFDIHLPQFGGRNAIIIGALHNSLEVIQYLVSLGINIQCTDGSGKNAFYLCAKKFGNLALDCTKYSIKPVINIASTIEKNQILSTQLFNNMKYLISIGIGTYQNNNNNDDNNNNMNFQQDIMSFIIKGGNKEEIEFIHSLYHSCEFEKYKNLVAFSKSIYFYDINLLKYLIENNIIGETNSNDNQYRTPNNGSILHILVNSLSYLLVMKYNFFLNKSTKEIFKRFNEYFDYFLERGNDINSTQSKYFGEIPFQLIDIRCINDKLLRMIINYLINKGSDLLYKSELGSVLHTIKPYPFTLSRSNLRRSRKEEIMKYIIMRSIEINEKSSAQRSMIQHYKIQNNNKYTLPIYNNKNNNNNEKEMKEEWKRVFSSFVLSPPLILSIENNKKQKFIINEIGELKYA